MAYVYHQSKYYNYKICKQICRGSSMAVLIENSGLFTLILINLPLNILLTISLLRLATLILKILL